MNAIAIKPIVSAVLLSGLLATSASFAQSNATSPVSSYDGQRFDSTTAHVAARVRVDTNSPTAPGPYAKYLLENGTSREDALKAASTVDRLPQGTAAVAIADQSGIGEPGPYAKYLMHVGLSKKDAIIAASSADLRQKATANDPVRSIRKRG